MEQVITCTDKNIKDNVNQQCIVLYVFTDSEMKKLMEFDILKIRFTIKAKPGVYGSIAGNYTAENIKSQSIIEDEVEIYDTSENIKLLLQD